MTNIKSTGTPIKLPKKSYISVNQLPSSDSYKDAILQYVCLISSKVLDIVMLVGGCNAKYLQLFSYSQVLKSSKNVYLSGRQMIG